MGLTSIEWCDFTFNPWWGCSRVSPACRNCYAATLSARWGHDLWHRKGPRRMMSPAYWRKPLAWNRAAEQDGQPKLVFCASMADVLEIHPVPEIDAQLDAERAKLWELIEQTTSLRWLLLTKRPENAAELTPWGSQWPDNVWLGTSVEDQRRAEQRIPVLLSVSAKTRFLSCEPLLERLDLGRWLGVEHYDSFGWGEEMFASLAGRVGPAGGLHWIISGGESGARAKPLHPELVRDLRDQAVAAGVPFFHKQWGQFRPDGAVYAPGETEADFDEQLLELYGSGCALEPDGTRPIRWDARSVTVSSVPSTSAWWMTKVGKKAAGRQLDGRIWNEQPVRHIPVMP